MKPLQSKLARYTAPQEAKAKGIYPYFTPISSEQNTEVLVSDKKVLMFGSNSYLGLTNHPKIKEAAKAADYYFIDITSPLKDENGDLRLECTTDGCHLNATGYFTWATELLQLSRLLVIGNPYEQEIK